MPAQYEPISAAALMGRKFLEELQAKLERAIAELQEHEERFGKRVSKASAEVVARVTVSYDYDKQTDEMGHSVVVKFDVRVPKAPELRRCAYVDDDGRLMVDTAAPSDPPAKQGMLWPKGALRINGRQVDPGTGEVLDAEVRSAQG